MKKIKIYQVDAFAERAFSGNPAAVCPLDSWLPDEVLLNIAMENNLAETAYYVKEAEGYHIRWFTPAVEVDLCGHATLATAFVLFQFEGHAGDKIVFNSRSGPLTVTKLSNLLTLNFPTDIISEVALLPELSDAFNFKPLKAWRGKTDFMLVFENEDQIRKLKPDFIRLAKIKARGVIATAKGEQVDFVSRWFGPQSGIDEDAVTGSAHTTLTPYWSKVLKKDELVALQLSMREGKLICKLKGDRVEISGKARLFLTGDILID